MVTSENQITQERSQKDKMMAGTAWLTISSVVSRLLGAIYIIPWYAWMGAQGNEANALFSQGYNIYALFLLISTAGIPVAIAREVAHYEALGDHGLVHRLIRQILGFMLALGVLAALLMAFFAPALSHASGAGAAGIPVMRSLALAVLIFPAMSVIRGYFQGLNQMKVVAFSQLYEQLIRVIWMLVLTFLIMKVGLAHGNWESAVTQSTTAAFIGMLASVAVLVWFLVRENLLSKILHPEPAIHRIKAGRLLLQTLYQAVPFVIIGSAIQIFKLVDQFTFASVMRWVTTYTDTQLQEFFADFSANTDKLTMIMIGTAASFGDVALPMITKNYTEKKFKQAGRLIAFDFQVFAAFMMPATVVMLILAIPFYTLFYQQPSNLQLWLFIWALLQSLLLGLYTTAAPILQALRHSRVALRYFAVGFVIKLVLQIPAIMLFHTFGPLFATTLSFAVFGFLTVRKIHQVTGFRMKPLIRGLMGIGLLTAIMLFMTALSYAVVMQFVNVETKLTSFFEIVISGGLGFAVYLILAAKLGLLEHWLGSRGTSIRRRLHI
ncbi:MAG: polysaccharide biosynthesis protein [Streptococcaceae bacterium]|jgi:O-antigen/teichoic acid export membrane protein|nr:polysaccharide biosynthesis protein [Streptococcaceae bacterium]